MNALGILITLAYVGALSIVVLILFTALGLSLGLASRPSQAGE